MRTRQSVTIWVVRRQFRCTARGHEGWLAVSRYCPALELSPGRPACDAPATMDAPRSRGRESSGGGGVDLEPATVLPIQLYGNLTPDASIVPEKRLLLAVLEEAVVTFQ